MQILDHGYIRLVETWGHGDFGVAEAGIIEAARQSTQGSFRGWDRDEKLLRFLYEHKHSTPFEFAGAVIEVQAPIFVFREWHRHRTQSYNEMSARYEPLPDLYYVPSIERLMMNAGGSNKQAGTVSGSVGLTTQYAEAFRARRIQRCAEWQAEYEADLANGIPKELARGGMPVEHYTRMRASANLRNWLSFLTLRQDPAAQWEIRQYANALNEDILSTSFPRTLSLFNKV